MRLSSRRSTPLRWLKWISTTIILILGAGALYEQISVLRDATKFVAPGDLIDVGGRRIHVLCKGS
ncbi:MAG TPA: hypothetical protein VHL14_13635, partial [Steroidobacteraceae bacterium]|nr:hypothetical protein [Steroidobacteraceae bacterium]